MNILVIGEEINAQECQLKFGNAHHYVCVNNHQQAVENFSEIDLIFDFKIEYEKSQMEVYRNLSNVIIFLNTAKISLLQLGAVVDNQINCSIYGFAGLPTFLNRELLEVSLYKQDQEVVLEEICKQLGTLFQLVDDRVGLVTPRVICMIINEAYYTLEEGTASRTDIDLAMKLGTNYPLGPFEWSQKIGIKHVYELLEAVYKDTGDERYKICPLLKKECALIQP